MDRSAAWRWTGVLVAVDLVLLAVIWGIWLSVALSNPYDYTTDTQAPLPPALLLSILGHRILGRRVVRVAGKAGHN